MRVKNWELGKANLTDFSVARGQKMDGWITSVCFSLHKLARLSKYSYTQGPHMHNRHAFPLNPFSRHLKTGACVIFELVFFACSILINFGNYVFLYNENIRNNAINLRSLATLLTFFQVITLTLHSFITYMVRMHRCIWECVY